MIYILIYLIIGLIYQGFTLPCVAKKEAKKYSSKKEIGIIAISALFISVLFSPLWPMFIAAYCARKLNA